MDFTDALKAGGASATLIAIVGIIVKIIQSFCGHRIHSECCGRHGTIGVSVENMSPERKPPVTEEVIVVRSARPSLETKDHAPAASIDKPESKAADLPVELQARL